MDVVADSLVGLLNFGLYFGLSLVFLLVFKAVYPLVTPYDEWQLVKEKHSSAAATALVGAIIGFCIALGSAASNSVSIVDFALWGLVALIAQLLAYRIVKLFLPMIAERIENDEMAAGIVLGGVSVAVGVLNGACMTY